MANCKICGHPVIAGPVMHGECLEQMVSDIAEKFCDSYCRGPVECISADELRETYCDSCPMDELLRLTKRGGQS